MFYNEQYLVLGYTSITNKWHLLYRCFVYYLKCMSIYSNFKSYTLVPYVPHNLLSLQPIRAFCFIKHDTEYRPATVCSKLKRGSYCYCFAHIITILIHHLIIMFLNFFQF